MADIKLFGIRHHGPGSARSLLEALDEFAPDCILVEGPPEGDKLLSLAASSEMKAPVALLVYAPDKPKLACYYPFAEFSPEWQAFLHASKNGITCRFMDLPQTNWLALNEARMEMRSLRLRPGPGAKEDDLAPNQNDVTFGEPEIEEQENISARPSTMDMKRDPIGVLARAAGFCDGERWWEQIVEQRRDKDVFAATLEAMQILRQEIDLEAAAKKQASVKLEISDDGSEREIFDEDEDEKIEPLREAHMRQTIRQAAKEFSRIAVVCGAWHAPALVHLPAAKDDTALLKGLPKVKCETTWIPWTHSRLSFSSGYGAGVTSPGWYQHIFNYQNPSLSWLVKVAQLLREEDIDASPAQVIDTHRLVEATAAMRDLSRPGLDELNEAVITVLLGGNALPLKLIEKKLIVGEALGSVPEETPGTPLEKDLQKSQTRLRLKPDVGTKVLELDLRKALDRERSQLLNRLLILEIDWGEKQYIRGKTSTFHENWDLEWYPELSIRLIEAGIWGRSIAEAASSRAIDLAQKSTSLATLVDLMEKVLEADLPQAQDEVMTRIKNEAALTGDVVELIKAVPTLARVARYGNVRGTDMEAVNKIVEALVVRIVVGLSPACRSLDDEAAQSMQHLLGELNSALLLLDDQGYLKLFRDALDKLAREELHGLVSGKAVRLLFEARSLSDEETQRLMHLALSRAAEPRAAGNWLEGFLKGSAIVLIHDKRLWQIVDSWVLSLGEEFNEVLPLMRRTFSTFSQPERRQIGERVRQTRALSGPGLGFDLRLMEFANQQDSTPTLDASRIEKPLRMVRFLLSLDKHDPNAPGENQ